MWVAWLAEKLLPLDVALLAAASYFQLADETRPMHDRVLAALGILASLTAALQLPAGGAQAVAVPFTVALGVVSAGLVDAVEAEGREVAKDVAVATVGLMAIALTKAGLDYLLAALIQLAAAGAMASVAVYGAATLLALAVSRGEAGSRAGLTGSAWSLGLVVLAATML